MAYTKKFRGYCPTLNTDNVITVDYNPVRDLTSTRTEYVRGRLFCEEFAFGRCDKTNDCPILEQAPTHFYE